MITHFIPGESGQNAVHHSWNVLLVTLTLPTIFQYLIVPQHKKLEGGTNLFPWPTHSVLP